MKIARFRTARRVAFGVVMEDEIVEIRGSIYTRFRLTDTRYPLSEVNILAPTEPMEMWGPGLNFADHLEFAANSSSAVERLKLGPGTSVVVSRGS